MAIKKYGIAFSGGGARGYAHIGVIKALLEKGIVPEVVAGTSAGAIVGALYCDGKTPDEIFSILKQNDVNGTVNFFNLLNGFLKHDNLKKVLEKFLFATTFEELKIPLFVNATDYSTNEEIVFSGGMLHQPVVASAAIPVIFEPEKINDKVYVDGGIANNLLTQPIRPLCEVLIGVHVNPISPWTPGSGILDNLDRAINMSIRHNIHGSVKLCDIFIEPPALAKYQMFDSKDIAAISKIGYDYTKDFLKRTSF